MTRARFKERPVISIILPTYNRSKLLRKAIDSVICQTYSYWELIVVDDGSTDNTRELVSSFDDLRIVYHWQENRQKSAARNIGLELATGSYIGFLDDDDYYLETYLERMSEAIVSYPEICIFKSGAYWEKDGLRREEAYFSDNEDTWACTVFYRGLSPNQVILNRQAALMNHFDEKLAYAEDYLYFMQILFDHPEIHEVKEALVVNVEHQGRSNNSLVKSDLDHEAYCRKKVIHVMSKKFDKGLNIFSKRDLLIKTKSEMRLIATKYYRIGSYMAIIYGIKYLFIDLKLHMANMPTKVYRSA